MRDQYRMRHGSRLLGDEPIRDQRCREAQPGLHRNLDAQGHRSDPAEKLVAHHDARLIDAGRQVELPAHREPTLPRLGRPCFDGSVIHDDPLVDPPRLAGVAMGREDAQVQDAPRAIVAPEVGEAAHVGFDRKDRAHGPVGPAI
jgi:hypothetical protein